MNEPQDPELGIPDSRPRFAARTEDWLHGRRAKRVRKSGKVPDVIPYLGYGSTDWVRVLGRVLFLKPATREHSRLRADVEQVQRVRGWRSFTSVHVPHHPVKVSIDGELVTEVLTDRGGVVDAMVPVALSPGWHTITLQTAEGEPANTRIHVLDPAARFGVISDVDDTILMTALPKPFVAAWNTFVRAEQARAATPGMPVLLDHLISAHPGAPILYLSTGAWNAAPTLTRFLSRNLYPMGPLLLTDWGPTHDRWFRSGQEHKRRELRRVAQEFPDMKWVLIGDDGQHDEELYHEFSTEHPQNVAAVAIRQLSIGEAVLAGGRSKAQLHRSVSGVPWVYGPDGATLQDELHNLGLV